MTGGDSVKLARLAWNYANAERRKHEARATRAVALLLREANFEDPEVAAAHAAFTAAHRAARGLKQSLLAMVKRLQRLEGQEFPKALEPRRPRRARATATPRP